jgi:succinate dehydrogenase/fumarate reductase flavoprotein subunit
MVCFGIGFQSVATHAGSSFEGAGFDICTHQASPTFTRLLQVVNPTSKDPDAIVPGLLAAGEAACASVHGANRLGANSLLDIVVFGRACANTVAEVLKPGTKPDAPPADAGEVSLERIESFRKAAGSRPAAAIRRDMQRVMQNDAAVFRTQARPLRLLMLSADSTVSQDTCAIRAFSSASQLSH